MLEKVTILNFFFLTEVCRRKNIYTSYNVEYIPEHLYYYAFSYIKIKNFFRPLYRNLKI